MAKYLDSDGLLYLWQKIKAAFALKAEVPAPSSTTPAMDGTASTGTATAYARADHVHPADTSRAPASHASSSTTYGKGTSSDYGHVRLSDSTTATTAAASGGTAATPKAVSDALAAAKAYSDTAYGDFGGATQDGAGTSGLVPAPPSAGVDSILFGDGGWDDLGVDFYPISDEDYGNVLLKRGTGSQASTIALGPIPVASATSHGLMSAADKAKLGGIAAGANAYTHPSYAAAAAAAVKVGRDASGHVVVGEALAAADVGAAASGHKHTAADLTSGTLGVARGGTGVSMLTGIVRGNGTSAMSAATASDVTTLLGDTAVGRATADASGNVIASTYATKDELSSATAGALTYKGVVTAESGITGTAYKKGWYWVVAMPNSSATGVTIAGATCEAGDMIIARQDKTSTLANDVDVVQSNLSVITNAEIDAIVAQ